jgi:citrate synthase
MKHFFSGYPSHAHPMAILSSMVCSLSAFYEEGEDPYDADQMDLTIARLLAKVRTIAAFSYKKSRGHPFVYPEANLPYCANMLHMLFHRPSNPYEVDPESVRMINLLLILHADHEQNCSTSTVRLVGSSGANLFAAISAGICALWGPLHGGANQAVIEMLEDIQRNGGDVKKYVKLAKDPKSDFKLMGFGHRVYKNFDPRAKVMKEAADEVLAELGIENEPLLAIAKRLEQIALEDEYFIEKKLYPNVDFYSGIILKALGIPTSMFTVIFAVGRTVGWIAHWHEMISGSYRIGRPRQLYTGHAQRDFVPLDQR